MNSTAIKTRLGRILGKNPVTVILPSGTTVTGTRCALHQSRVQGTPGYATQYRGSILIEYPSTLPTQRSLLQVDSVWYRVLGTEPDSLGTGLRIDLGEPKSEQ